MGDLSLSQARRVALAAQGFDRPRPARGATAAQLARLVRRLGLVQLDFVKVVGPAHYHVPFSRLGPYRRALLDEIVYEKKQFTEQWAHEASIVPVETWPLLEYRRETHRARPWGFDKVLARHRDYVDWVLEQVRSRGPLSADELPHPEGSERRLAQSWFGTIPRAVLEWHFGCGRLAIAARRENGARVFDLTERVHGAGPAVARGDAHRELIRQAARAHGVGTAADLADYWRMPVATARTPLSELVDAGELELVRVEGWRERAYLHRDARPAAIDAAALLSPFDPVVWYRPRLARLFEFEHRFEIFVPDEQRRWGVYVMPFLLGDRLVARVDLKSDRAAGTLLVPAAYLEAGVAASSVLGPLVAELKVLAGWMGLEKVQVGKRGDLARGLARAV